MPAHDAPRGDRLGRRGFLAGVAATAGFGALDGLVARQAHAAAGRPLPAASPAGGGYGPLRPVTRTDPVTGMSDTLLLPEGFDFRFFGCAGTRMDDGAIVPLGHDGMAAFPGPRRTVRLVRNHEEATGSPWAVPSGTDPARRYDVKGSGGTSTLEIRFDGGVPVLSRSWMSIAGTIKNCAGGPTPWGSWLTCEETTEGTSPFKPDSAGRPYRGNNGWTKPHGYVFEVPSAGEGLTDPVPLTAMGRFVHEAIAVDPWSGHIYETEDRDTAGFYRFTPARRGKPAEGGRLQMLKVKDRPGYDTRTGQRPGRPLACTWVDIADPDPAGAESDSLAVYKQGAALGGATFARIEGCWWGNGAVYFCATEGGDAGQGQVWEYRPLGPYGVLRLVFESPGMETLSFPDNITVTPRGSLLLCEDTDLRTTYHLQGLTRDGTLFPFCSHENEDEWCGATFSPDGRYLFANLQGTARGIPTDPATFAMRGRTVAIWGPWERGPL
ncbi:alkaline phosphatase PhoX [Bailinhaonella thermotolerans]|uniref:DUF839 domain-containing protein n=1 Tax=Bailinhaonella thermotolerans TaxID=1070861 RepID=A0A3A4BWM7_9ACTN|nr:alkaline phosphatase PhoX [Bailinhaonella thermotolerans]RJL35988.1 DUF839 domain-containing protein [Bailinhaonella thermotolerans]